MRILNGFGEKFGLAMADKSPWGSGPKGNGDSGGGDKPSGPRNPWLPGGGTGSDGKPRRSPNIEDIFKNRGPEGPRRAGSGGGGGNGPNFRLPTRPGGKSWVPWIVAGVAGIWLVTTSVHQIQPTEQGVVTWFGAKYSRSLTPGLQFTLPWPIQSVAIEDVTSIRAEEIPGGEGEKLILTGDQNLVDLSYLIRWNIKDVEQFRYQLAEPAETVREVAEAAMRASVAEQELDSVLSGEGRAKIEMSVRSRMQGILDAYRSGIAIQGIEIEKTDPPERVIEAFKDVSAAQQDANTAINRARAYAEQVSAQSEGASEAFNKIYEEYRLAPEVTRRRLYYETMESVLSKTDKTIVEAQGVQTYLPLPEVQRRSQRNRDGPTPPAGNSVEGQ